MDFEYDKFGYGKWLKGPEWAGILEATLVNAEAIYSTIVAKRTGRLSASPTLDIEMGGKKQDRLEGVMTVGVGLGYGASHEFGTAEQRAAHDLQVTLNALGAFG